jgi:hypothetical protein
MLFADKSIVPALFWTSATDEGCEDSFGYCTSNRLLRTEARSVLFCLKSAHKNVNDYSGGGLEIQTTT